jgi:radical SAM superfamily enzyme YgiQ (UPF0313 family)
VNSAMDVLKEVKNYDPRIVTGIGGHHATFMPHDCAYPFVDTIFLGMSDISLKEYIDALYRYVCNMDLFQPVFTVLTPLPGTELYETYRERLAITNYDFFDHVHSVLPTKLNRREFYAQFLNLYVKCYSYRRYFKSVWKDFRSKLNLSGETGRSGCDRLSLIKMILLHMFTYPLKAKMRNLYRSEPAVER